MAQRIVNLGKLIVAHEALQAAVDALAEALPAATPDTRVVTSVRLAPEMLAALKVLAAHERTSVNDIMVEAIRNHLEPDGA